MALERTAPQADLAEVLDRVLDRGIVIDAWVRVSVAGIALIDVDARVVVASISTYVRHAGALAQAGPASRPPASHGNRAMPGPDDGVTLRRPARGSRVRLRCAQGCTFTRAERRLPARVRCPVDPGHHCPVQILQRAA